jgi:putative intracellular protease/amidase
MKTLKSKFAAAITLLGLTLTAIGCKKSESKETPDDFSKIKNGKVVLVVLSAENKLLMNDQSTIKTGYILDELAVPAQALIAAGYTIEVATPGGAVPHMDENSNHVSYFQNDEGKLKKALEFVKTHPGLNQPLPLKNVAYSDLKKYSAVFIPGGRAPMTDLMESGDLGKILRFAHQEKIVTALLCHGPVALTAALENAVAYRKALVENDETEIDRLGKNWIYANYEMTIFSNSEEDDALKDSTAKLQFYVADALKSAGGKVKHGKENWKPFVVQDRELITGQNPASDHELADALLKALRDKTK